MKADCHMHMVLDGVNWKSAIARHKDNPQEDFIRNALQTYKDLGYTYLRDGGDKWGVGAKARELAPDYGITYRTPLSPLCKPAITAHLSALLLKMPQNLPGRW